MEMETPCCVVIDGQLFMSVPDDMIEVVKATHSSIGEITLNTKEEK
jgi:hypothetical protein